MDIEILRGEIERLFSLDEMTALARNLMGMDPEEIGGTQAKGSFARALTERCNDIDALDALVEAVIGTRRDAAARLRDLHQRGFSLDEVLAPGDRIGPYTVRRRLGEGSVGIVYSADFGQRPVILKVLRREASRDARALHRFFTVSRLIAQVSHPGLPENLVVGHWVERGLSYVAYDGAPGESLAARTLRDGAMSLGDVRPIFRQVLEALAELHDRGLAHGNLKAENVILQRNGSALAVRLVDAGTDRLRLRARLQNGHSEFVHTIGSPKTIAPEQIRGTVPDSRADVYALGAMLFELLTGRAPFPATTAVDAAVAHLIEEAEAPSEAAPRGYIPADIDRLVLAMLAKDAKRRPRDARVVLTRFDASIRSPERGTAETLTEAELEARIEAVLDHPDDEGSALRLDSAVQEGADPTRVAETFSIAANTLAEDDPERQKNLLFRAARIHESHGDHASAEGAYARIVELDPSDDIASAALMQVRRSLGKYEEVVEMLLQRADAAGTSAEKARTMAEIGRIYAAELDDPSQAVVAYAQAFCDDPHGEAYADEVERLAGADVDAWTEATTMCAEASAGDMPVERKALLFARLGRWYVDKLGRTDLAVACFQAILATNPNHDAALAGLCSVYQKAQQWAELAATLQRRAQVAPGPSAARNLLTEAAEVLENKLGDVAAARELYARVLDEDPTHLTAGEGLQRILENVHDYSGLVKMLEAKAEILRGERRWNTLTRIGEVFAEQLNDLAEATRRYELVLEEDQHNIAALKGLDHVYLRTGRYRDLIDVLERQIQVAVTPRQRIGLYERLASIYEEEFIDRERAAQACEAVLAIDPQNDRALAALARHYAAQQRWEDVAATYERHLATPISETRQIELLLALGDVLLEHVGSPARAAVAYERLVQRDPNNATALEALAKLRASSGDAAQALRAVEALAQHASTPEAKAEQWLRAARILEDSGDVDGAIERYKLALDAAPDHAAAGEALRAAYTERGDAAAAVELITQQIERTSGPLQKAKLLAEAARLTQYKLHDAERALALAAQAHRLDATNIEALLVLGDVAFEDERFLEAATYYEMPARASEKLARADATRLLLRYVDALYKTGASEKALAPIDLLLEIARNDAAALARVARVSFDHGEPRRAYELYHELLTRFRQKLSHAEEADALYRLGEAARRANLLEFAAAPLLEAADLDPSAPEPLAALAKLYEASGDWESVVSAKTRRFEVAEGDERHQLLLDIAEIFTNKLEDRTRAAETYIAALEERPEDRNVLTKLMQLYSEEKDWTKLVDVVLKLSDFVDDDKQKAKYLHTAAMVSARQLGDIDTALAYYERALELDPTLERALQEAIALCQRKGDYRRAEALLKLKLEQANEADDQEKMLEAFEALAVLYHENLGWIGAAIDAYEAAQTLDPENKQRNDILAGLYASDPAQYLDKAVQAHRAILKRNPDRAESYKLLRKLYTETKRADAAWCMCQALYLMNLAEPAEEKFFKRMRADTPAAAQTPITADMFQSLLVHEDADPVLSSLFALIEPAVVEARAQSFEATGYDPAYAVDLANSAHPIAQTIYWAASVLGLEPPPTFENPDDLGGLSFLHASRPSIVVGRGALTADMTPQATAFIVARHLTYYRPGFYVRHLVPTGTGLKAWLFAAIKMISPAFPIQTELENPMRESLAALERAIVGTTREHLASLVAKLLSGGGALDLKQWVAAVDLTADRVGFLLAHDLQVAGEIIKASGAQASAVPVKERLKELILFATSEPYFVLRSKLGLAVDS